MEREFGFQYRLRIEDTRRQLDIKSKDNQYPVSGLRLTLPLTLDYKWDFENCESHNQNYSENNIKQGKVLFDLSIKLALDLREIAEKHPVDLNKWFGKKIINPESVSNGKHLNIGRRIERGASGKTSTPDIESKV